MVNLSLIEIHNRLVPCTLDSHGKREGNLLEYKTEFRDKTASIFKETYGFTTPYTLIYLYNLEAREEKNVLALYGEELQILSSGITFLTYFEPYMLENWPNIMFKEQLENDATKSFKILEIIRDIQEAYEVKKLPALIVLKKEANNNEQSFNIELPKYHTEDIYNVIKAVMEIINQHYNENFTVIHDTIGGQPLNKKGSYFNCSQSSFIKHFQDRDKKAGYNVTQVDLATAVGLTDRRLRTIFKTYALTPDQCFIIALMLHLNVEETNHLLKLNRQAPLGLEGRDRIIRDYIINRSNKNDRNKFNSIYDVDIDEIKDMINKDIHKQSHDWLLL